MKIADLIDAATAIVGSYKALAEELEVSQQRMSDWKHSRRPCPDEVVAELAAIAGLDPGRMVIESMADRLQGTRRGARLAGSLRRALSAAVAPLIAEAAAPYRLGRAVRAALRR